VLQRLDSSADRQGPLALRAACTCSDRAPAFRLFGRPPRAAGASRRMHVFRSCSSVKRQGRQGRQGQNREGSTTHDPPAEIMRCPPDLWSTWPTDRPRTILAEIMRCSARSLEHVRTPTLPLLTLAALEALAFRLFVRRRSRPTTLEHVRTPTLPLLTLAALEALAFRLFVSSPRASVIAPDASRHDPHRDPVRQISGARANPDPSSSDLGGLGGLGV